MRKMAEVKTTDLEYIWRGCEIMGVLDWRSLKEIEMPPLLRTLE